MAMLPIGALLLVLGAARAESRRDSVPLFGDLGTHHVAISTKVPAAQRYFDQGMRLVYAFNHAEAIRAFDEAARLDPSCAICHWGAALAYGPHVNIPAMDSAASAGAWGELQQAVALAAGASPRERDYIGALSARYTATPPANRAGLDSAYARAMGELVRRWPDDPDAATLYAEAIMDLSPWNYWNRDGSPRPQTPVVLAQLERVMRADSTHPGACHYYIHAVEAVAPQKAVACAERLAAMMPGAGHMVHMPAHIYIRVGRYAEAIDANVHAVHADEGYMASEHPRGMYPLGYYPHNYHFLAFAASMAGRSALALDAARRLGGTIDSGFARAAPEFQPLLVYHPLTLVTFGRWNEVLAAPLPPSDMRVATGLVAYARGMAYAATSRWADAGAMLDTVRATALAVPAEAGDMHTVLLIASHALAGDVARRRGRLDEAVAELREAAKLEDGFFYNEPPQWYSPVRRALGAALLDARRPAEAEAVYREDLQRFPANGWSLRGLALALRAEGRAKEAKAADAEFARAWAGADVKLASSRF